MKNENAKKDTEKLLLVNNKITFIYICFEKFAKNKTKQIHIPIDS